MIVCCMGLISGLVTGQWGERRGVVAPQTLIDHHHVWGFVCLELWLASRLLFGPTTPILSSCYEELTSACHHCQEGKRSQINCLEKQQQPHPNPVIYSKRGEGTSHYSKWRRETLLLMPHTLPRTGGSEEPTTPFFCPLLFTNVLGSPATWSVDHFKPRGSHPRPYATLLVPTPNSSCSPPSPATLWVTGGGGGGCKQNPSSQDSPPSAYPPFPLSSTCNCQSKNEPSHLSKGLPVGSPCIGNGRNGAPSASNTFKTHRAFGWLANADLSICKWQDIIHSRPLSLSFSICRYQQMCIVPA